MEETKLLSVIFGYLGDLIYEVGTIYRGTMHRGCMHGVGNPELYDPTDTGQATSRPTNGRQFYKWCRPTVAQWSPDCWGSVGLVSAKCRWLFTT